MNLASVLGVATLAIGVPLNLYVVVKLARLYRASRNKVVRDREITAAAILLFVVVFGLVFVNNDLPVPVIAGADTKIITRLVALIVSVVPAAYWLWIYRRAD